MNRYDAAWGFAKGNTIDNPRRHRIGPPKHHINGYFDWLKKQPHSIISGRCVYLTCKACLVLSVSSESSASVRTEIKSPPCLTSPK
jgi:hypothetical protein